MGSLNNLNGAMAAYGATKTAQGVQAQQEQLANQQVQLAMLLREQQMTNRLLYLMLTDEQRAALDEVTEPAPAVTFTDPQQFPPIPPPPPSSGKRFRR